MYILSNRSIIIIYFKYIDVIQVYRYYKMMRMKLIKTLI